MEEEADSSEDWDEEEIEAYNREIDEAMKEMDEGHFVPHEEIMETLPKVINERRY